MPTTTIVKYIDVYAPYIQIVIINIELGHNDMWKFVKMSKVCSKTPWNNTRKSCEEEVHVKFDIQKLEKCDPKSLSTK
jgi:hypothetical protein